MPEAYNHDYLFTVTDKDIRAVIYDVGTARDCCTLESEDPIAPHESTFAFLDQAELLQRESYALSEEGKHLFELLFLFPDEVEATEMILLSICFANPFTDEPRSL